MNVLIYDILPEKCEPHNLKFETLVSDSDVIMLCVPTPMKENGECDTSIVEDCIERIQNLKLHQSTPSTPSTPSAETSLINKPHIVVRSTVPVGFCKKRGVNHMPEFLTEANWKNDFKKCKLWIIGVTPNETNEANEPNTFKTLMINIICDAQKYDKIDNSKIEFVDTDTTEFVKYGRNCFLAAKLSICNEYYTFCTKMNIEYDKAIELIGEDKRIGKGYTKVPGPDGKCGWSGTCFPKDTRSFINQCQKNDIPNHMINAALKRNDEIDRIERDWKKKENKGRTFV